MDEHWQCSKCGEIDGPIMKIPTCKAKHGKCRCGGSIKDIQFPPRLPGMNSSDWVVAEDDKGNKFPAVYDHKNEVWRRSSYPGRMAAYMWISAETVVRWGVL